MDRSAAWLVLARGGLAFCAWAAEGGASLQALWVELGCVLLQQYPGSNGGNRNSSKYCGSSASQRRVSQLYLGTYTYSCTYNLGSILVYM